MSLELRRLFQRCRIASLVFERARKASSNINCGLCALSTSTVMNRHREKEMVTEQFIGKNHKKAKRMYVWGNTRTGALG